MEAIGALSTTFDTRATTRQTTMSMRNFTEKLKSFSSASNTRAKLQGSSDACEQAKNFARENRSYIYTSEATIDNATSEQLEEESRRLSRDAETGSSAGDLNNPRVQALNTMSRLLSQCSAIRKQQESPTNTLFGLGEQVQDSQYRRWMRLNLATECPYAITQR